MINKTLVYKIIEYYMKKKSLLIKELYILGSTTEIYNIFTNNSFEFCTFKYSFLTIQIFIKRIFKR